MHLQRIQAIAEEDRVVMTLEAQGIGTKPIGARSWTSAQHVLKTLDDLGFRVPAQVQASAANTYESSVRAAGAMPKVDRHLVDQALKATTFSIPQRIAFKLAADRFGFLK
jgi:hypothetical protein